MQAAPDVMLGSGSGSFTIDGAEAGDFYVRQLWDSKGSAETRSMETSRA